MRLRIAMFAAVIATCSVAPTAAHAAGKLPAPSGLAPAGGASVQTVPPFTWSGVRGAEHYEFQLAADQGMGSVVENGRIRTRNTAATVRTALANGKYWWRVRAVGSGDRAGRWTKPRAVDKSWTASPKLLAPADDGLSIRWPTQQVVLRWTAVPYAQKYSVIVATDPKLANTVLGSVRKPVVTQGTQVAMDRPLNAGRYYWQITPIDTENFRGTPSDIGSFQWHWPTATDGFTVSDSDARANVFDPLLRWNPVPGAARYEVEINASAEFAEGARVFLGYSNGGSIAPTVFLPNNDYSWRVRAIDAESNKGEWNVGPTFRKDFDKNIGRVHIGDDVGDDLAGSAPETSVPFFSWDPVPGAFGYLVQFNRYLNGTCGWLPVDSDYQVATPNHYWGGQEDSGWAGPGQTPKALEGPYCMRITAYDWGDKDRRPSAGDWEYVEGDGDQDNDDRVAFTWKRNATKASRSCADTVSVSSQAKCVDVTPHTPYFRWKPARCTDGSAPHAYRLYLSHDVDTTNNADPLGWPRDGVRSTTLMYAPTVRYVDETTETPYHLTVAPVKAVSARDDHACGAAMKLTFKKRSEPPALLTPSTGESAPIQQVFQWTPVHAAKHYDLQVASDANFGKLVDDVETASTSYASQKAYPAHTQLYWRVRAVTETPRDAHSELNWSETRTFTRDLPIPRLLPSATGGETIPVFAWEPIQGAVSYDMHVDQSDGTARDFRNLRSTKFTPILFYGTGVWRWKVRANFPGGASGGFSQSAEYVRRLNQPVAGKVNLGPNRMLFTWLPDQAAKFYRVEISDSDSFTRIRDGVVTPITSWAPDLTKSVYRDGGTLWWRLAVVDEGRNVGAYTAGKVALPKAMRVTTRAALRRGQRRPLLVTVRNVKGQPLRRAFVRVTGAGVKRAKGRTGRQGTVRFRLRPTKTGAVTIKVRRKAFYDNVVKLSVR